MLISSIIGNALLFFAFFSTVYVNAENCAIEKDHVEYTRQRIREAILEADPFPFMIINDIFHSTVYDCILQNLESMRGEKRKVVKVRSRHALRANEVFRQSFDINREDELAALRRSHKFKYYQVHFLRSLRMILNLAEPEFLMKFEDTLRLRRPPFDRKSDKTFNKQVLTSDWSKYEIFPHIDTPNKLVTVLVYLPENRDHVTMGTSLLKKRKEYSELSILKGGRARWDWFDFVVNATFTPNKAVAFSPCSSSWHGVRKINTNLSGPRITLQFFVMNKEKEGRKIGLCG